jgi:hypothetical protein
MRPQTGLADFYREMDDLFGVELAPHNRWAGAKVLRDRWLQEYVVRALQKTGAVKLVTPELIATLCDHAQGNPRALVNIASELLAVAAKREARQIDEKLFLETCATPPVAEPKTAGRRR